MRAAGSRPWFRVHTRREFATGFAGVLEVTLFRERAECGPIDRDAVRRMEELEKQNARPKRLVVEWDLATLVPDGLANA